ncbi:hypothetical protein ACWKSP_18455 [Micromonosporaceae bacterium Da 78-11]
MPVHYEGWSRFREGRAEIAVAFSPESLTWLATGIPTDLPTG